jgi:hypothetical protein
MAIAACFQPGQTTADIARFRVHLAAGKSDGIQLLG